MTHTVSSQSSVTWVDTANEIDLSFVEEVSNVPLKAGQAIVEPLLQNYLDTLFEIRGLSPWALFIPFKGYFTNLKKLFKRNVLSSFSVEVALEILDNYHENEGESEEGEKIYEMLSSLDNLNNLLEEITLRVLSTMRS